MITYLNVRKDKTVYELQEDFNKAFPFLKIELYKNTNRRTGSTRGQIQKSTSLGKAGIKNEGTLRIPDSMTVAELENIFKNTDGTTAQVSRKSGSLWLETTMTDSWTLRQQNEHGRELSMPAPKNASDNEYDYF